MSITYSENNGATKSTKMHENGRENPMEWDHQLSGTEIGSRVIRVAFLCILVFSQ
jgi:hypothetical protein